MAGDRVKMTQKTFNFVNTVSSYRKKAETYEKTLTKTVT